MALLPLLLLTLFVVSNGEMAKLMGVNYGQLGNDLPSAAQSIKLIKNLKVGRVKIYDANPKILQALANTNLQVSIMVPNQIITNISSNPAAAARWVRSNLLPYCPSTRIRVLLVGNEILSDPSIKPTWLALVPAIRQLRLALKAHNLTKIKVGTPVAMDALSVTFPPSNASFRPDVTDSVIRPLLQFASRTKSFFFVDVYTYFFWTSDPNNVGLDYALLGPTNKTYTDPGTGLTYTDLLDQLLDAVAAAMARVGFHDVRIAVVETGWPNGGDYDQIGVNVHNAAVYNRNLARKVAEWKGTPARPGWPVPMYIFSLFNENQKPGPGTERHWGVYYPNGTRVYEVDLTGKTPDSEYAPLPAATNNEPYKGKIWCVVADSSNATALAGALSYACGQGTGTCDAIQKGGGCYQPNSLVAHANYAFNSYWQQFRGTGGTCYFNGLAAQTTKDPSYGSCKFPCATAN